MPRAAPEEEVAAAGGAGAGPCSGSSVNALEPPPLLALPSEFMEPRSAILLAGLASRESIS